MNVILFKFAQGIAATGYVLIFVCRVGIEPELDTYHYFEMSLSPPSDLSHPRGQTLKGEKSMFKLSSFLLRVREKKN